MKIVVALVALAIASVSGKPFSGSVVEADVVPPFAANSPVGPVGTCPPFDGEYPVYLVDLKDRHVYYECTNGSPRMDTCSANLVFNPVKNVCDYPCRTCEEFGPVGGCPAEDGSDPVYLRDGFNIATFYVCERGTPRRFVCDAGLVYDPYAETCTASEVSC